MMRAAGIGSPRQAVPADRDCKRIDALGHNVPLWLLRCDVSAVSPLNWPALRITAESPKSSMSTDRQQMRTLADTLDTPLFTANVLQPGGNACGRRLAEIRLPHHAARNAEDDASVPQQMAPADCLPGPQRAHLDFKPGGVLGERGIARAAGAARPRCRPICCDVPITAAFSRESGSCIGCQGCDSTSGDRRSWGACGLTAHSRFLRAPSSQGMGGQRQLPGRGGCRLDNLLVAPMLVDVDTRVCASQVSGRPGLRLSCSLSNVRDHLDCRAVTGKTCAL